MNNSQLLTILSRLPYLGMLLEKYGDLSIFEYAQKSYRAPKNITPLQETRKNEMIDFLTSYVERKFDTEMSGKVRSSLRNNYAVSTAEHHGPMGHPFFFQSALLRGIVNPENAIVNLCTSHVSLGNSSYPRGLIFHSQEQSKKINQISPPVKGGIKGGLWKNTSAYSDSDNYFPYSIELWGYAKEMRKNPSLAEKRMWYDILKFWKLKKYKFTRQKPLLNYIADFYCSELKLVIEVDGDDHENQRWYDSKRTEELEKYKINVLRFHNLRVLDDPKSIEQEILQWIINSQPTGATHHLPSQGGYDTNTAQTLTLPFFPSSMRMSPVFHMRAFTQADIEKNCLRKLTSLLKQWAITQAEYDVIISFVTDHVLDIDVLQKKTYSEQITLINHRWWKYLFPDMPDFMPLDSEDIICELLIKHLKENTFITRLLTDGNIHQKIEQYFNGISCCFDFNEKKWTFLFWYLDKNHNRHALWKHWNELVSSDWSFRVQLNSQSLTSHLSSGSLIPSGLLVYTIYACYYGLTCFGGFAQGDYLPQIQQAYANLLKDYGNEGEISVSHQEAILNEDMIFVHNENGTITSALDIQLWQCPTMWQMIESAKKTSLHHSLKNMIPEILRCL